MGLGMSSSEVSEEEVKEPLRGVADVVDAWADAMLGKFWSIAKRWESLQREKMRAIINIRNATLLE